MANRDIELLVRLVADTKGINQGVGQVNSKLNSFSSNLKRLGLGLGIAAGAKVAIDWMGDAISMATDLEEAQNRVNVVFGDGTDAVKEWAEESASGYRMSQLEANKALGDIGSLLKGAGLEGQQLADASIQAAEAIGDIASFANLDSLEAANKVLAGLSGEMEGLRRLGIDLSAGRVKTIAEQLGLQGAGAATQRLAALQLQMDNLGASGDSLRTLDSAVGKSEQLRVKLENLQTTIGEKLVPAQVLWNEALLAGVDAVTDWLELAFEGGPQGSVGALVRDLEESQKAYERLASDLGISQDELGLRILAAAEAQGIADAKMRGYVSAMELVDKVGREVLGMTVEQIQAQADMAKEVEDSTAAMAGLATQSKLMFETLGQARKEGVTDWSEILPDATSIKPFDFDFGSPTEWIKDINQELREANIELGAFLKSPKAQAKLEAGVAEMGKRMTKLLNLTTQTADLGTAGGNLMTVFGASILSKTNKAKDDVGDAMEALGLSGSDDFIKGFKPTSAQWLSTLPDRTTIQSAAFRLGLAARTGFLQGFGNPVPAVTGGAGGGGEGAGITSAGPQAAPVSITVQGALVDPIGAGRAVVEAIKSYEAHEGALWRKGSGATRTRYG